MQVEKKHTVDLEQVIKAEDTYIAQRRHTALAHLFDREDIPANSNNKVGLALSGGGMRSAIFNLGVVQALARLGLLPWVDYLATVSGGGYLGTCLTALLSIRTMRLNQETSVFSLPYITEQTLPVAETQAQQATLPAQSEVEVMGQPWWPIQYEVEDNVEIGWACTAEETLAATETTADLYVWQEPAIQAEADFLSAGWPITKIAPPWYKIRYRHPETDSLETGWIQLEPLASLPGKMTQDIDIKFNLQDKFPFKPDYPIFKEGFEGLPTRNHQLYHLRLYGNFVIPRAGLLKQDTLRAIGSIITGIGQTISIFIILFLMLAALHYVIAGLLLTPPQDPITLSSNGNWLSSVLVGSNTPSTSNTIPIPPLYWVFLTTGAISAIFVYFYIHHFYRSQNLDLHPGLGLSRDEYAAKLILRDCVAFSIIILILMIMFLKSSFCPGMAVFRPNFCFDFTAQNGPIYWLWMPAAYMLGSWLVVTFLYPFFFETKIWQANFRSLLASWQGLNVYGLVITIATALLALPYYLKFIDASGSNRNLTMLTLTTLISALWSYFLAGGVGKENGTLAKIFSLSTAVRQFLLNTLIVILIISLTLLWGTLFQKIPATPLQTSSDSNMCAGLLSLIFRGWSALFKAIPCSPAADILVGGALGLALLFMVIWLLPYQGSETSKIKKFTKSLKIVLFRILLSGLILYLIFGTVASLLGWIDISATYSSNQPTSLFIGLVILLLLMAIFYLSAFFLRRIYRGIRRKEVTVWDILPWSPKNRLPSIITVITGSGWVFLLVWSRDVMPQSPWTDHRWLSVFLINLFAVLTLVILSQYIDLNRISFHYFYRDRLAATFLQTNLVADRTGAVIPVRDQNDLLIQDINPDSGPAPYHLLITTLNLPGSKNLTYKDSKSEPFIFSRYYCGSHNTTYIPTYLYRGGLTQLARAAAISGAAISSTLGQYTFFGQAFIMTLFNIRLGYWMDNPQTYRPLELSRKSKTKDYFQLDNNTIMTYESNTFWAKYLWYELTGTTQSYERLINLSDGGHTDNLALYPLLQRRCKLIIVSDAGADPAYEFSDISRLIRRIYIEEGIQININLDLLRPDPKTGFSRQSCAVGQITYPDEATIGWLIYLKPVITGTEEGDIKGYWWTHQDKHFPHQTTADQFYDDDQFEAYRRLGELTVQRTVQALKDYYETVKQRCLTKKVSLKPETYELLRGLAENTQKINDLSGQEIQYLYKQFTGIAEESTPVEDAKRDLVQLAVDETDLRELFKEKICVHFSEFKKAGPSVTILDAILGGQFFDERLKTLLINYKKQNNAEGLPELDSMARLIDYFSEQIMADLKQITSGA